MTRIKVWGVVAGVAAGLFAYSVPAYGQGNLLKNAATGDPQVKSIEAIGFGPQGVLLIGDGKGAQVVAVDTGDTTPMPWTKTEIAQIADQLAGRIGTTAKGIEIVRMVVNPASTKAYFAVRKSDDKTGLILTLDGSGKVNELQLTNVKHSRIKLPAAAKATAVTDIVFAGDRVLAAVQANETFGSKIISVPAPLENGSEATVFSTETYHVAHGKWETKAPIRTLIPYEQTGKKYVVGAFTCTPIVKYPLTDLAPGATVKGQTVIELGNGNTPRDMFTYEKDGKTYILMSTFRIFHKQNPVGPSPYWTAKVDAGLLTETDAINEKAVARVKTRSQPLTDRATVVPTFHGVVHMDRLDNVRALVVRTDDKGKMDLAVLPLP